MNSTDAESNNTPKKNILIVDDTPANLRVLSQALIGENYGVRAVKNGRMALMAVRTMPPDLILLDINMPEQNGYEVCQELKGNEKTRDIPVIFLSALNEGIDKVKAFKVGGADYITKPFQLEEVFVRISNQIALQSAKAEITQLNTELERRVAERTNHLNQKINELNRTKKKLHDLLHDRLTDLPNHTLLTKYIDQEIKHAQEQQNYGFALLMLECDLFQTVGNSLEKTGIQQLRVNITQRLQSCIGESFTLACLGEDKFAILLREVQSSYRATHLAEQIYQQFAMPFPINSQDISLKINIGIVLATDDYTKPAKVLRNARLAMVDAKKLGENKHLVYERKRSPRSTSPIS